MELWYSEMNTETCKFSIKVKEQIYAEKTPFQTIAFFESYDFGRFFTLDGLMMVNEKDEFIYHDMITHVPLAVNPNIKKVLVIGGGDGGTVRELTRYKGIEMIHLVEIDERVVRLCQEYLPITASKFDDPRVTTFFEDGVAFMKKKQDFYDLILVDSTDPIGPGEGLFTSEFYENCYNALKINGILVNQHESPFYPEYARLMQRAHKRIKEFFPISKVYQVHIPTYASGHWLFGFASKTFDPVSDFDADKWNSLGLKTEYYNTDIHKGAFAIPNYVKELLEKS